MAPPRRRIGDWSWLWLLPVLYFVMAFEYGVMNGLGRFMWFVYVGSFVFLVGLLVAALLGRAFLKQNIAVSGVVVFLYSLFQLTQGNGDKVFSAAVFGVIVGLTFGIAIVFVSSLAAERVRRKERALYAKVQGWFRGRR